jgi:hypothetical protein
MLPSMYAHAYPSACGAKCILPIELVLIMSQADNTFRSVQAYSGVKGCDMDDVRWYAGRQRQRRHGLPKPRQVCVNCLVAHVAHGRKLISFRLPALNDSPPLSFTLLNYIDQLQLGCLNDVHLSCNCRLSKISPIHETRLDGTCVYAHVHFQSMCIPYCLYCLKA